MPHLETLDQEVKAVIAVQHCDCDRAGPLKDENTHLPLYRVAFLFIVLFNSWKCQDVK